MNNIKSNLSIRICKMQEHDLGDSTPEFVGDGTIATSLMGKCITCGCDILFVFEPAYFLYEVRIEGFNDDEPLYVFEQGESE